MKVDRESMRLYVVTDRTWLGENQLEDQVEAIVQAGATFLQIREKNLPEAAFIALAKRIKRMTDRQGLPFVVNDSLEVALAADADGVHVGQSDLDARNVRAVIGPHKIVGVSVQTVEQAIRAQESGADYIGVGAVFVTGTKADAEAVSLETLKTICSSVSIPVVAIGGINEKTAPLLKGCGIDGIAVVSAIFEKPDVALATAEMLKIAEELFSKPEEEGSDCAQY